MRICFAAAEVAPFAKTGGLADVVAALTRYLQEAGHGVLAFVPAYRRILAGGWEARPVEGLGDVEVRVGPQTFRVSFSRLRLPGSEAGVVLVHSPELYDREPIYTQDGDEPVRFALLSHAALAACQHLQWAPDVVHAHDWHAALLPLLVKTSFAWDRLFSKTRSVLTVHNIGYQGVFSSEAVDRLGLAGERHLLDQDDLRSGRVNFLKTGLLHADALTTVSQTYAREIQTPELGAGLDPILRRRSGALHGILNGVDYAVWSPETDPHIAQRYSAGDLAGKVRDKQALMADLGLRFDARVPVLGIVSRLTAQKGFDLLPDVLPIFLQREDLRLAVLGSGEEAHERYFQWLQETFPDKVCFYRGYNDALAHKIEAGSDIFLMPSRYEPCGLNQMYSLKYGTIPVVRRTGGLADTVRDYDAHGDGGGTGTGFVFEEFTTRALRDALERALAAWRDPAAWHRLVQRAMAQDFSWQRQGARYVELYARLVAQ